MTKEVASAKGQTRDSGFKPKTCSINATFFATSRFAPRKCDRRGSLRDPYAHTDH
jgi:hypothetical protein